MPRPLLLGGSAGLQVAKIVFDGAFWQKRRVSSCWNRFCRRFWVEAQGFSPAKTHKPQGALAPVSSPLIVRPYPTHFLVSCINILS